MKIHRYLQKKYNVKLRHQSFSCMQSGVMPYLLGFISQRCDVATMHDIIRHMPHLLEMGERSDSSDDDSELSPLDSSGGNDELNDQLESLKIAD